MLCLDPEPRPAEPRGWRRTIVEGHQRGVDPGSLFELAVAEGPAQGIRRVRGQRRTAGPQLHPDVIYATSTPLTIAIPAIAATAEPARRTYSKCGTSGQTSPSPWATLENRCCAGAAKQLERAAYARASHVVALAPGMKADIVAKGPRCQRCR